MREGVADTVGLADSDARALPEAMLGVGELDGVPVELADPLPVSLAESVPVGEPVGAPIEPVGVAEREAVGDSDDCALGDAMLFDADGE